LLKWHSLLTPGNQRCGGYSEAFDPSSAVNFLDSDPTFLRRYRGAGMAGPYNVRAAFGFGWDAINRKTGQPYAPDTTTYPFVDHFHVIAQQQSNSQRQVIVSNEKDFFEDFENNYGQSLPSQSVTYGNEWDLYSASMSETSAGVKRAVEKLRTAELLATMVSLNQPNFMQRFIAQRDEAFVNLGLYWEHNWTADGPISRQQRANWQEMVAAKIESYVDSVYDDGLASLSNLIANPTSTNRFYVLNPLNWLRTEHADLPFTGDEDIHVRDLTSARDVPHQLVQFGNERFLRILATNVPSVGYKVFEIQPGPGNGATNSAATFDAENSTLENKLVRVAIEPDGSIKSFIDKARGDVELAASIDGMNLNDLARSSNTGKALEIENSGPVSTIVRARSQAGLDHETTITVYRNSARVDLENEVFENFGNTRYLSFSFAIDQPSLHTEEVGALNLNKLKANGGNYADSHARYDFLTVNHFADFTDGAGMKGMTISNADLAFGKLGRSSAYVLDTSTPQLNMLSGGQVDGATLGIVGQNGNKHFVQRFALCSHGGYDQTAAMKFSLEHQNPLIAAAITNTSSVYPETNYSLLRVSDPSVILWALKPSEEGMENGVIARFWNVSDVCTTTDVTINPVLSSVVRTTHIETNLAPIARTNGHAFSASFNKQQLQTFRLMLR
jgi:alpha-mannosidase